MDHPLPWLRYVEAGDLDDSTFDFDGLDVKNAAGEKLGDVNGFILDADSARPYYVVVDSKGWFKTKHYLLPIGHAQLDVQQKALIADLSADRIKQFPGFDLDKFAKWTEDDLNRFTSETADVCCVDVTIVTTEPAAAWHTASHYQLPNWWDSNYYRPDRAGAKGVTAGAEWSPREASQADRQSAMAHDKPRR
jgi:hypothetical protein